MNEDYFVFNETIRGSSHIKKEVVCQDYSMSGNGNKYAFIIVSDGHGSEKYFRSDRGSKIACETTHEAIKNFMSNLFDSKTKNIANFKTNPDDFLKQLEGNILYNWRKKVENDMSADSFSEEEKKFFDKEEDYYKAYGCTLIVNVLYFDVFWFGIHIGDGKCVVVDEKNNFTQPVPWDDKCFLNVTTSLCDADAIDNFRHKILFEQLPSACFIGSDGIDDSFSNNEQLHDFYNQLLKTFQEKGFEDGKKEIVEFLPVLSQKGSGDDVSIAGIVNKKAKFKKDD